MRRPIRVALYFVGAYALAWTAYAAKSAAGINVLHDGVHHGPLFPGSDRVVTWLRNA